MQMMNRIQETSRINKERTEWIKSMLSNDENKNNRIRNYRTKKKNKKGRERL